MRWIHIAFMLLAWVAFAVAFSALGTMMYWLVLQPRDVVHLNYEHDKFVGKEVRTAEEAKQHEITFAKRGQTIYRYQDYCLKYDINSLIHRYWRNGVVVQLPVVSGVGKAGCWKWSFPMQVPEELRPGQTYTFHWRAEAKINPLVTIVVERSPLTLKVVE